jgi:hypothetical protein
VRFTDAEDFQTGPGGGVHRELAGGTGGDRPGKPGFGAHLRGGDVGKDMRRRHGFGILENTERIQASGVEFMGKFASRGFRAGGQLDGEARGCDPPRCVGAKLDTIGAENLRRIQPA